MLVQALNGFFYKNPVAYGKRSIMTCHDYGAHVCVAGGVSMKSARGRAGQALKEMEIKGKLLEGEGGKFLFGTDYTEGWKFEFVFRAPIPVPLDYESKTQEPAKGEFCAGFFSRFWDNEIVEHLQGLLVLPLLQRALLGEWIEGQEALLKRRLFRQCPDLRKAKSGLGVMRRIVWCLETHLGEELEDVHQS